MAAHKSVLGELHEALAQLMLNELRWYMEQDQSTKSTLLTRLLWPGL